MRYNMGSLYYQPKQVTFKGKILQNDHTFALFDPPKIGNSMIATCLHYLKRKVVFHHF